MTPQDLAVETGRRFAEAAPLNATLHWSQAALDREAEYRADEGAQVYLARAGLNPLALYSVLQKFVALGRDAPGLAQLYKTHPPFDARIDRIDQRGYGVLEPYTTRD
jgi:predicted Zn-dependent protease